MVSITFLGLLGLAFGVAYAKGASNTRPRGRFARSVVWDFTPPLPEPRVRKRALAFARSLGLL